MGNIENRIDLLSAHIDGVLFHLADPTERRSAFVHFYGVAHACALIALKRGENAELATMAGLLHDLYAFQFADAKNHAEKGSVLAREVLGNLKLTNEAETDLICSAIANHSAKAQVFSPFDEVLIDADVMQHGLLNITKPIMAHEQDRFQRLAKEFGFDY